MSNESTVNEKGLNLALALARKQDVEGARIVLNVPKEITDEKLLDVLVGLDKGLELFRNQNHIASLEYFQKAFSIVEAFGDDEAKFVIRMLSQFAEGLSALFSGDAHTAAKLLNIGSKAVERMCFFYPEFKIASFSYKAASLMALARTHLNAADIPAAEGVMGEASNVHDEFLMYLNLENSGNAMAYSEIYGTRLENAFLFIMMVDLPSLDLSMWRKRLEIVRADKISLEEYIGTVPKGPIQIILSQYPIIFKVLDHLLSSLEVAILKKRPFNKEEVNTLVNTDAELAHVKQLLQKCGERGKGMLFNIDTLSRLQQNLLQVGKLTTQDFGRFSGIVAFVSFIVLIVIMHFTVEPTGWTGLVYYLGALIISLIAGFGYGALRFRPLLTILANAIDKESKKG